MAENTPVTINRNERVLAYMVASALGLSLICIIATLIATGIGVDRSSGIWSTIVILPGIGLPIGFILIIVLLITSAVRRSRAARDASK